MSRAPSPAGVMSAATSASKDSLGDFVGSGDLEARLAGVAGAGDADLHAVVVESLDAETVRRRANRGSTAAAFARALRTLDREHAAFEVTSHAGQGRGHARGVRGVGHDVELDRRRPTRR